MIYLVELDALDGADQPVTLRFSDAGIMTAPSDTPANTFYAPHVSDPGNIERHLFSDGRTFGDVSVGAGDVRLKNTDGSLDHLRSHAFDGRAIRIYAMRDKRAPFASRQLLLEGTVAQTEFQDDDFAVTVRDWLEALRQPLQSIAYKGTTTQGGMAEAEGGADLKDKTKTMLFGTRRGVPAVLVDAFDLIYEVASNGLAVVAGVFDRNVPLAGRGNFPTLAALKAAPLVRGEWASCLALGIVRLGGLPDGLVTVDASEGATVTDRTAGQIARRVLLKAGNVEGVDFLASDIAALDAAAPYECGVWYGPDGTIPSEKDDIREASGVTTLQVLTFILGSVRGSIAPDFSGVYRIRQFAAPDPAKAKGTLDERTTPGLELLDQDAPGDHSDGLPVKRVTIRYALNSAVASASDIDNANVTPERKAFAMQDWRQVSAFSEVTAARHLLAHTMVRDTALCREVDAQTEALAVLALYSVVRRVFREKIPTRHVGSFDLSDVLIFRSARYGLEDGRAFVLTGRIDEFEPGHTTLVLWS